MEIYMDDMLMKSFQTTDHIRDLEEAFGILRQHQMKLNSTKCTFEKTSEKFFRFLMSQRGIEANLEKIKAIINMKHLSSKKEI